MRSRRFFLALLLLCLVRSASFSEGAEKKIWLTEAEYDAIILNMMDAQKQLSDYKRTQNRDLQELSDALRIQSEYCKEQEKERKRKMAACSAVCFTAGVLAASGAFLIAGCASQR